LPKEVIAIAPRKLVLQEYEENPLKPNEVRIRSRLSSEKHGTNLPGYRGEGRSSKRTVDPKYLIWVDREVERSPFPHRVGNMYVGVIVEVGSDVTRFKVGERVFGYGPIRETHTLSEERANLAPSKLTDEELVCLDPAVVALMAVREGNVKIGEKVAVFGLGAIGLMALQLVSVSGALLIIGIELIEKRLRLAKKYGADILINPKECDAGLELRKLTDMKGVDIAIEASGSYRALHHAIRGTRYGGTIVPVSVYHGEAIGLNLSEEWHINRQVMVSGARVESEPYRDYPRWDRRRIEETVIDLFAKKKLNVEGMLDPIVEFDQVGEGYRLIDEEPEKTVKLAVRHY